MSVKSFILVVGLAALVQAGRFEFDTKMYEGYTKLNDYLLKNEQLSSETPDEVLAYAQKRLSKNRLFDGKLKDTINLMVLVSKKETCDLEALNALHQIVTNGLNLKTGKTLVEKVLARFVDKWAGNCESLLKSELERLSKTAPAGADLVSGVSTNYMDVTRGRTADATRYMYGAENYARFILYGTDPNNWLFESYKERIYYDLIDLTKDDAALRIEKPPKDDERQEFKIDGDKLKRAFDKYLAEPCKHYNEHMGAVMEAHLAYIKYQGNLSARVDYLVGQPEEDKDKLYHYRRCQVVLSLKDKEIKKLRPEPYVPVSFAGVRIGGGTMWE